MTNHWPQRIFAVLLLGAIVLSIAVVNLKQQQRILHSELYRMRADNEELLLIQSQLLVESSTLASYNRVEAIARDRLAMRAPEAWEVIWLRDE